MALFLLLNFTCQSEVQKYLSAVKKDELGDLRVHAKLQVEARDLGSSRSTADEYFCTGDSKTKKA